jgi:hypothetical protein
VKREAILGFALLVLFLFLVFPAHVRAQGGPTLTLDPTSGSAGSRLIYNYSPGFNGFYCWDNYVSFGDKYIYRDTAGGYPWPPLDGWPGPQHAYDSYNRWSDPTIVPSDAAPGTYTITETEYGLRVLEAHGGSIYNAEYYILASASTSFTVTVPTITLDPAEGKAGSSFKFTVSGFPQNDNVYVAFGDTIPSIGGRAGERGFLNPSLVYASMDITTDSSGSATGSLTVPSSYFSPPPGRYNVTAGDALGYPYDNEVNNQCHTSFLVTGGQTNPTPARPPPVLTLHTTNGPADSSVKFSVSHFSPNTYFNIIFPSSGSSWINTFETDASGAATGIFTVPYVNPATYTVTATDTTGNYATAQFTVTPTPETITITSYVGTTVSVRHAGSSDWIELSDPTSYVWQEGDTIATETNTVIRVELGSHGTVTLAPDSSIFVHTISESDVTYSVTGNTYQQTSETVRTVNGVEVVTDSSSNQAIQSKVGDPQFIIAATNTSALIQVFEGTVTLSDSSRNSVSIGQGYQSSIALNQAPTLPVPINDVTPPSVQSAFPASSQSSISESTPISVTFSEAIDPSSTAGLNFTLMDSKGALVNGEWTVLYQTVIFTPQSSLPDGTYVVDVKGGSQGVRDLSGNALLSDYTFTFIGGASVSGGSANSFVIDFGSTAFILVVVAVVVVTICAVALVARKLNKATSHLRKESIV